MEFYTLETLTKRLNDALTIADPIEKLALLRFLDETNAMIPNRSYQLATVIDYTNAFVICNAVNLEVVARDTPEQAVVEYAYQQAKARLGDWLQDVLGFSYLEISIYEEAVLATSEEVALKGRFFNEGVNC